MVYQWIACIALQLCGALFMAAAGDQFDENRRASRAGLVIGIILLAAGAAVRP